jgi:hypothetical protein
MSQTQFLDESEFSIKLGGVEINPSTGDGIEGLLKIAGWTVQKTIDNDLIFSYEGAEKLRLPAVGPADIGGSFDQFVYTATADQTTFSGADDSGTTMSYDANNVIVYMNGILLTPTEDYTASNGTSVSIDPGAAVDDIITVQSF